MAAGLAVMLCCVFPGMLSAQQHGAGALRIGLEGGLNYPGDDFSGSGMERPGRGTGAIGLEYYLFNGVAAQISWIGGYLSNTESGLIGRKFTSVVLPPGFVPFDVASYRTMYFGATVGGMVRIPFVRGLSPLVAGRLGVIKRTTEGFHGPTPVDISSGAIMLFGGGVGLDVELSRTTAFRVMFSSYLTNNDEIDGWQYGKHRDGLAMLTAGFYWSMLPARAAKPAVPIPFSGSSPETRTASVAAVAPIGVPTHPDDEYASLPPTPGGEQVSRAAPPRPPITAELLARDLAAFKDLAWMPNALTLTLRRAGTQPLRLTTALDMVRDGVTVARASGSVLLMGAASSFDARAFLDMETLTVSDAVLEDMEEGRYLARVTITGESLPGPVRVEAPFDHYNLERVFGSGAARIRSMLASDNAVARRGSDGVLELDAFVDGADPLAPTAQRAARLGRDAAARRIAAVDLDDALTVLPPTVLADSRAAYLSTLVRNAHAKAAAMLHALPEDAAFDAVRIIGARTYFAHGDTTLSVEAGMTLDAVAQVLDRHPDLRAELRAQPVLLREDGSLAQHRANAAKTWLLKRGVRRAQISAAVAQIADAHDDPSQADPRELRRVDVVYSAVEP